MPARRFLSLSRSCLEFNLKGIEFRFCKGKYVLLWYETLIYINNCGCPFVRPFVRSFVCPLVPPFIRPLWPQISHFRPPISSHRPLAISGQTKVPLCSTGLCPVWGRCPASPHCNLQSWQVAQGQYVVSDTRCPALHDCELVWEEAGQRPWRGRSPVDQRGTFVLPAIRG